MTAIAAASTNSYITPLQQLQKELAAEVSSGQVSSNDATALSSALTNIDQALQSGQTDTSSTGGSTSSPGDMKSKIDDLISSEVSSGKLTSDQADELKKVFENTFAGGPGGTGGPGGAHGHHHHDADGDDASAASSTDSSSSSTDTSQLMQDFIKLLQQQQSSTSATTYGANGSSTSSGSFSALLINYQT